MLVLHRRYAYGRRRNSKDEITLRGIPQSVVRTPQLGPNRDSPGRAREPTRKFQIELAKLEGRAFNEMRSSLWCPNLRSFFYDHSFRSCILYFPRIFSFFPPHHELTINAISTFSSRSETFIYVTRVSYNNYELPRFVLYFEFIVICKLILPSKGSWSDREVYISRFVELNLIWNLFCKCMQTGVCLIKALSRKEIREKNCCSMR